MTKSIASLLGQLRVALKNYDPLHAFASNPSNLQTALTPAPVIWRPQSVIEWHRFLEPDYRHPFDRTSFIVAHPDALPIGNSKVTAHVAFDISQVQGLECSKSSDIDFRSMTDLADYTQLADMDVNDISSPSLWTALTHYENRILNRPKSSDFFACDQWDGRLFLCQAGGSHHFAVAQSMASKLGVEIPIVGRLHEQSIDALAVRRLQDAFAVFAFKNEVENDIDTVLQSLDVTYYRAEIPTGHEIPGHFALFLSKDDLAATRAADILRRANATDLCVHLLQLTTHQMANAVELENKKLKHAPDLEFDSWRRSPVFKALHEQETASMSGISVRKPTRVIC